MWSDDIRKTVDLLQQQLHFGEVIEDPIEYVAAYKPELRAAGPELQFLQLAVADKTSSFSWKPTAHLIKLIAARQATIKKSKPLYEADFWWDLFADCVFGRSNCGKGSYFTSMLLEAVGLLYNDDGEYWVTEDLHVLFNNGYYDKRQRDGLPFGCQVPRRLRMSARGWAIMKELEGRRL
jgi:hypothetical protein